MQEIRVRYLGCTEEQATWKGLDDPRGVLTEVEVYTLTRYLVHFYHSEVMVEESHLSFNSVCFELVTGEGDG